MSVIQKKCGQLFGVLGLTLDSATPGRGLKPTHDFPANPRRFPALAAVISLALFLLKVLKVIHDLRKILRCSVVRVLLPVDETVRASVNNAVKM